jgi:hypothetical protein
MLELTQPGKQIAQNAVTQSVALKLIKYCTNGKSFDIHPTKIDYDRAATRDLGSNQ